ncbi:MAG: LytTR family DNA-binding domain-containing protein [Pseudoxanthomonas sp.]
MNSPVPTAYERFLPWKRGFEIGFWVANMLLNATFNSITTIMDIHKAGLHFADWEPAVWEWSSNLLWIALVWPLVWFTRRFPLHWDTWRRHLPWHLLASVVFSLVHVTGMVGLRVLAYRWMGGHYDFGSWPKGLFYEYLKDVRTFFWWVALIELYRLAVRRLQGEARLLDVPDEGPPVEPVDRPERFLVRKLGREFLVAAGDIEWLQAAGNYVNLRVRGHDYPLRSTIAGIESKLDPVRFVRIHRSYIVNLDQVASIEPLDTGDARVHLRDGGALPASRTYRNALRASAAAD